MPDLVLIADDLTGAADSGAGFAAAGFTTAIPVDCLRSEQADVLCLTTNCRDLPLLEADRRVHEALRVCGVPTGSAQVPWLFKKMDSALRGHPAEELLAVMGDSGLARALVAPATPAQGRTTLGGIVFDHGTRLAMTAIGAEHGRDDLVEHFQRSPEMPVRLIDLATVRGSRLRLVEALSSQEAGITIADAETDQDLEQLAEAAIGAGIHLYCGAAGLAGALARRLPLRQITSVPPMRHPARPVLVIAGSRHAATARQIETAIEGGARVIHLAQRDLDDDAPDMRDYHRQISDALASGADTIVTTAGLAWSRRNPLEITDRLVQAALGADVLHLAGGLVLTGGDVAAAVCRAVGARTLWLRGEVLSAIPWGTLSGDDIDGLPVVTKAGSFGPPEAIHVAIEFVNALPVT